CATGFDSCGELGEPLGARTAAVEANESVERSERETRAVQQLLNGIGRGEEMGCLAHLERSFGGRPLIWAGADEVEPASWDFDARARRGQRRRDGIGNHLEIKLGAEGTGELSEAHERAEMTRREGAGALLRDRL